MERIPCEFFDQPGKQNTPRTLALCFQQAEKLESKTLLIPSTTGYSAQLAVEMMPRYPGVKLVVVGHRYGFRDPGQNELAPAIVEQLQQRGVPVLLSTHAFTGLEKSFSKPYGGMYPHRIIADTLRIFSQGTKVVLEDMVMAADSGLVPIHSWIVCAGGTGRGLDTAMVVRTVHSDEFFEAKVAHILCLPGNIT
ncbi:MAG TPA: pyruvate kinase alpha/beta domain-containing protein [Thermotogota bacterium]|nr:pyruvate kinase alpha/beta domain-containing protein [Thermotogota bacterium]HRW92069.1 pyruvate kinase alpha/beta domain-containing protein [Thermotogota bacterium]